MSQNSWDNDELLELLAKLVAIGKSRSARRRYVLIHRTRAGT
jgi:hypothetical protein